MSDFIPPLRDLSSTLLADRRFLATDMDGTLTVEDRFPPELGPALMRLQQAGWTVVIVTGRSAGWVQGLAHYLPIQGAIAENGGLFYGPQADQPPLFLTPIPDLADHRRRLAEAFSQLQIQFPQLQTTTDNDFRLTDWTFTNPGFAPADLTRMAEMIAEAGWDFTYSSVQCHIKLLSQNKQTGLLTVLQQHFSNQFPLEQVITLGDSPNDQELFDPEVFTCTVGVANLAPYLDQIRHHPRWLTRATAGCGFLELVEHLLPSPGANGNSVLAGPSQD